MTEEATKPPSIRVERRADGVAVIVFDRPGESLNTLHADFATDFATALDRVEADSEAKALVITSGKKDTFIAGADLNTVRDAPNAETAARLSASGQAILDRLARSNLPSVAAIHGACLGGGLEVALACSERVASDHEKTKLGVPEVQLGLLPGLGGTQRLPRRVGLQASLDLMLTGRQVNARRAKKIGLVDEVTPEAIVLEVACERAQRLATTPRKKTTLDALKGLFDREELTELALAENPLGRKVVFDQAKKALLEKTHGNYPAPERILEVVRVGLERGIRAGLDAEAEAFGELAMSSVARELIRIFFVTQELKKDRGVEDSSVAPRDVRRVGILGAGLMGAGIAYVSATRASIDVRVKDRDTAGLGRGLRHVRGLLDERVSRRRMTKVQRHRIMSRITATVDYSGFAGAGVIVEAVFEDLNLKRSVVEELEATVPPDVVIASNTSSIPITKIAEGAKHAERILGMHYFSPVNKMPLLEVISTEKTAPWAIATAVALGKKQGKTVIVVRDGAGFYTSRILAPYLNEAVALVSEGVKVEVIDHALVDFGFPVGPLALLDEVGLDVAAKVAGVLCEAFGDRIAPGDATEKLIADQRLGRKNGRGFYQYGEDVSKGKRPVDPLVYGVLGTNPTSQKSNTELTERVVLSMVNEAVRCLSEGILRSARDGDAGAIFGLGFPPYLGGPFRYADALGAKEVVRRLERLSAEHGERFKPAPGLVELADVGKGFYS